MADWQPIATAPRDGTRMLFWDRRSDAVVSGCWHIEPGRDDPSGYDPGWAWWSADADLVVWDQGDEPNAWMPFPTPPETKE